MPDVEIYSICSNLDLATGNCRLRQGACPISPSEHRQCSDATFVARVVESGSEFHVLLDSGHCPTTGHLPVRTCRQLCVLQTAGVHVNSISSLGAQGASLDLETTPDRALRYRSRSGDVSLAWSDGQFTVMKS